jgi:urease accessory protein
MPRNTNDRPLVGQVVAVLIVVAFPSLALAHVGVGPTSGVWNGLAHPITGLDHILAMLAVGLWAARRGGRAIWMLPMAFVTVMVGGGLLE